MNTTIKTLVLLIFCGFSFAAQASTYKINDSLIDRQFEEAEDLTVEKQARIVNFSSISESLSARSTVADSCDPLVSFLLCTFLGNLGIHRIYMGTDPMVMVAYILTFGGCGVVALIDWVMLLVGVIDNDISGYCNNPRFFMW